MTAGAPAAPVARAAERVARLTGTLSIGVAMLGLAALSALFGAAIVMRLAGVAAPGVDDIASILLAAVFAFAMAGAEGRGEHLVVDILVRRLRGRASRLWGGGVRAVTLGCVVYLASGLWSMWVSVMATNQMMLGALAIPRALPVGLILAGVAAFALVLAARLVESLAGRPPEPQEPGHVA